MDKILNLSFLWQNSENVFAYCVLGNYLNNAPNACLDSLIYTVRKDKHLKCGFNISVAL